MRTKGSKNIKRFGERTTVPTSSTANVKHLASIAGGPLKQFIGILNHQASFLSWLEARHDKIVTLKKQVLELQKKTKGKGPTGGKEGTFVKYRWYAEHLVVLEAINAFESFYKSTFTALGIALQGFVNPDADRKVSINAKLLWGITGGTALPALVPTIVFEHQLFHDLDEVDGATDMLIGKRRYRRKDKPNPLAARVKALQGIFQVRHTLSHNCGNVTKSDQAKFKALGLTVTCNEVIDPAKEKFSTSIFKELESEAEDFTSWLRKETAVFLSDCITNRSLEVPVAKRAELEALLGADTCWATVAWKT